ncbi:MAG: TldD/PmbA family protein [Candidatus Bathyarchaeota archaeon]|nr:MAG: TldD/PmbA family protein [Candidatus Bathyarchaeota archaeon]
MTDLMDRTENLVKKAKALGADEAIAKTSFSRRTQVRFSNNEVDITKVWNDYLTEVTLTWQKRVVATEIRNFAEAEKRVEDLFGLAKVSQPNPFYGGVASGSFSYPESGADKRLAYLEEPTAYVEAAMEAAGEEVPRDLNAGGALFANYEDVYLVSSEGPMGRDARSAIELSIRAFSEKEASGHGVSCSSTLDEFDPVMAGRKAGEIAWLARSPVAGEEGSYEVVFDPLIAGSLLGRIAQMASAFFVMIRFSVFVDKLGQMVAPEYVTLLDNAAPYSVENRLFDDEGVPISEKAIINCGVLKTYLHNTSTAKQFNTETTGNAGLVVPQPWNIEMEPGSMGREEMFAEVNKGLYLTNTWYTRFQNFVTGDFSTIPRDGAFVLEDGEIVGSIKDIRISDNVLRMLKGIKSLTEERQRIHWWESQFPTLSPYMLVEDVRITRPR